MRTIYAIGIGPGDPEHVTVRAINTLREVDVFFLFDKGTAATELARLRTEILERYVPDGHYRVVHRADPQRARSAPEYTESVDDWRRRRADICAGAVRAELGRDEVGGFLVWGDPALYDSTLAVFEDMRQLSDVDFTYEVIPGISSISALAARHRTTLNQVGRPVQITTGRHLATTGFPSEVDDSVVMLDSRDAFLEVDGDPDIYWGAYVGMSDEILVSGKLSEVGEHIAAERANARAHKGWLMDSYLLRRDRTDPDSISGDETGLA